MGIGLGYDLRGQLTIYGTSCTPFSTTRLHNVGFVVNVNIFGAQSRMRRASSYEELLARGSELHFKLRVSVLFDLR
jgi:hypothetical protein